jgi:hypothetical protein
MLFIEAEAFLSGLEKKSFAQFQWVSIQSGTKTP